MFGLLAAVAGLCAPLRIGETKITLPEKRQDNKQRTTFNDMSSTTATKTKKKNELMPFEEASFIKILSNDGMEFIVDQRCLESSKKLNDGMYSREFCVVMVVLMNDEKN